jgi:DNA polymerase III subunit beta
MNFSIKKTILLNHLNIVSKALSSKNLIPILGGIKFRVEKEGLYLTSTDNDLVIESFISKEKEKELIIKEIGTTVINGKYVLEIIRKLTDEIINICVIDGVKVLISTSSSKFYLY